MICDCLFFFFNVKPNMKKIFFLVFFFLFLGLFGIFEQKY